MRTTVHHRTPSVSVLDNRGLTVRTLSYHRHPGTPGITDERITRHRFTPAGFPLESCSPRQYDLMQQDASVLPERRQVHSLSGTPLLTDGADDGCVMTFTDVAGRPVCARNATGTFTRWQYEDHTLPGRPLLVTEQDTPEGEARVAESFSWGMPAEGNRNLNLVGACTEHQTPAVISWLNTASLSGEPLITTQQLIADASVPGEALITTLTRDATGAVLTHTDGKGHIRRHAYNRAGQMVQSRLQPWGGDGADHTEVRDL